MAITKKYIEATGDCNNLEISLDYDLGGYNWYNGNNDGRGYYLYVTPVYLSERNYNGQVYHSVQSTLGKGIKKLVKPVQRRSKKAEAEAVELAKQSEAELINYVCNKYGIKVA